MYVGYARNFNERKDHHFTELRKGIHTSQYLQNAVNKEGIENFLFEILVECPLDLLASEEHYWATIFNVHDEKYGYNLKPTNPYGKCKQAEETKIKIGESNKGYQKMLGKKLTVAAKLKIGIGNTGKIRTEMHKENNRLKMLGKKLTTEHKDKISKNSGFSKPVLQFDLQNVFIQEYPSMYAAQRALNKKYLRIKDCCNNTNGVKQSGGFIWKFKN